MNCARRVQRLEDIEAIRRLKARYLNACDSQDPESAKDCFAAGRVVIDMGHVGVFRDREAFAEIYRTFGCQPFILDMHHGTNSEIEFTDDTHAKALWALEYRNFNTAGEDGDLRQPHLPRRVREASRRSGRSPRSARSSRPRCTAVTPTARSRRSSRRARSPARSAYEK